MQVSEESSFKVQIEAMKTYNDVCGIKMGKSLHVILQHTYAYLLPDFGLCSEVDKGIT